ncbi:aldo/keto reductase [Pseudoflavonifractor phocaeensis]|uniref:aldo/keto reductase n=1 Tax=Pseudoflavonifractor phocaeensis TaxID=1870988 RepID=UPI002FF452D3
MSKTETVTLNNGVKMPLIGYGTYQTPPRVTERCVAEALRAGYRAIDTAQCYGNEREVGLACQKSGLSREALFLTTKLWACHGYQDTLRSIDRSLKKLDLGYIDLLLIHEPTGDVYEIYRAMETACQEGKLRAIGISNFLEDRYLDLVNHCKVVPAVNQVETHVFRQQRKLRGLECQIGTRHESWSPLACGRNGIWKHPTLLEIAGHHGKSVSQIALRFLTQQGIIVIPKSTDSEHMRENLASLDFDLGPEEMGAIGQLEAGQSLFGWW